MAGFKRRTAKTGSGQHVLLLSALLVLLAAWFGWSAWVLYQEGARRDALLQARDAAVQGLQQNLQTQTAKLDQRVATPAFQAAVSADDTAAVGAAIKAGWPEVEAVDMLPADLQSAYADAASFGYSKLALLEAAQQAKGAIVGAVRDGTGTGLALAVPVQNRLLYVRLPMALLTAPIDGAQVPGAYLALRQGGFTLREVGDADLSGSADALSRPVGQTGLRVAAAVPDESEGPLGLGALPSAIVAALLLALAALVAALTTGKVKLKVPELRRGKGEDVADDGLTLDQAVQSHRAAAAARAADEADADAEATATDAPVETVGSAAAPAAKLVRGTTVDPGIFRAYDIRGVVGKTLSVPVAELIGQAIGSVMAEQGLTEVVVARDGRLSGPELSTGLIEGLRKAGRDVIDIGMVPTPVAYFAAFHLRTGTCVAVTGSHNPPDYNGFKIVVGGETLSGAAITDLYARISEGQLHGAERGGLTQREIAEDYVQRIASDVQLARPLKVVVDAGNGVAGEIAPVLLEAIGAEVVPLYCDIDGTFPNHHPDPSEPDNLLDLASTVKRFDADLGLAFDGDGDRLGVVTHDGHVIFPDRLLMLFAADVLERNPGAMVIYDVKCTGKLQGWTLRNGGTPLMWQTGHSLIKAKMRETGAELAGEMSGHFFFQERWYGFDDGLYAAARLLEILAARDDQTPSEILDALPDGVSTPEIKVEVPSGDAHAIVQAFVDAARFDGARLSTIDGLRADWDDGWGLLRASNTTPVLVLRFEASDAAALERIRGAFRSQLQAVAPELKPRF
ncbi:phosphomannomutase/phosphoglucomutase [Pseudoxanthomonas winnipegensis]|uniref:phosphomannomutase n=1 Tax=Pseudoxanthomonas winnipegensis TaxID=2480810 RepID=A0ABY1W8S1_9GAMM|nr:phosphomannomutase/phosphoglucomutase [Pseudoxanthomonas winnipegensis]TAA06707.1 phosphomannomutase/phosphoglucomutase [Pseudoxanthomonas winnipegensis]TAA16148.1 phosphomannomutase/phosphoglucomutase [Pseudoxanthomonas winnipegensis]TAH69631.1 phosphomannomutase/phosphoglucomutase [Pseudoxanthomonas winnipegensis]